MFIFICTLHTLIYYLHQNFLLIVWFFKINKQFHFFVILNVDVFIILVDHNAIIQAENSKQFIKSKENK